MPSPKLFIKDAPPGQLKVGRHPWIRLAMICVGMVEEECKTFSWEPPLTCLAWMILKTFAING